MNRFTYILIGFVTFSVGILFVITYKHSGEAVEINSQKIQSDTPHTPNQKRFLQIGGFGMYGSFKSSGSEPVFANDCVDCRELGDISIYHNSESPKQTSYTLKANCVESKYLVEKDLQLNEKGEKIGERCFVVFPEGGGARIFWTEGEKDCWIISAPTLKLVKEFESSEEFRLWKSVSDSIFE